MSVKVFEGILGNGTFHIRQKFHYLLFSRALITFTLKLMLIPLDFLTTQKYHFLQLLIAQKICLGFQTTKQNMVLSQHRKTGLCCFTTCISHMHLTVLEDWKILNCILKLLIKHWHVQEDAFILFRVSGISWHSATQTSQSIHFEKKGHKVIQYPLSSVVRYNTAQLNLNFR